MQHLVPGKILEMNVSARAKHYRASSVLPCSFRPTNPYWCRRPQSAKDIDLICFKTFPIKAATCSHIGPMTLDWPVDPFARFDHFRSSLSREVPSDDHQRDALPASTRSRWKQNTIQAPPQVLQRITGCDGCGPFLSGGLRCVTNTRGLIGSVFPHKRTESSNSNISRSSLTPTTFSVSRRYMVRTSISRLFMCWLHDLFFLYFLESENAGGSAICVHRDILPEEAIVTHVITCQGPDHLVKIQSERHNLVIVNVHFEPELTLRQLRGRLHLIHPHWLALPQWCGHFLWVTSTSVIQKKDKLMFGTKHSPMATRERLLCSILPFHMSVRLLNLITREGTPQPLGSYALCQGLIVFFLFYLWARDLHCYSHVFENLVNRTIPSDHAAVRLVFQKPTPRGHQSKRIPSWMSKHPIFCFPYCSSFMTTTDFLLTHFVRLQNLKFSYTRPRR